VRDFGLVLAALLIAGLGCPAAFAQAQKQTPDFNVRVDLVSVDVEVLDLKGNPIVNLDRDDFVVKENGVEMGISNFSRLSDRPVSLAIVLDTSAIPQAMLRIAKQFIFQLMHLLGREDELCLYTFDNSDAYLEQGFTRDRAQLIAALDNIGVPSGRKHTLLNDLFGPTPQIGLGIDFGLAAALKGVNGKKALVVISDRYKGLGPATVEHVETSGCTFLTLGFSNKANAIVSLGGDAISKRQMVRVSGGRQFSGDKGDIGDVSREVAYSLKNHYHIGYLTKVPGAAERRSIDILVPGRDCKIYARRSYISPR
jgi:VWFA-related protein